MNYDYKSYEFYEFLDEIEKTFISKFASSVIRSSLIIQKSEKDIIIMQKIFSEAISISADKNYIENDDEAFKLIPKLKDDNKSYDPKDFIILANFLSLIELLKTELISNRKLKYLYPLVSSLNTLPELIYEFKKAIDDNGEIKDDATETLKNIRKEQLIYKNKVIKTLQGVLTSNNASKFIWEDTINLKNGRYTISCKSNFHQYIEGIIQDRSTSGQTYYIEPSNIVSINNAMQELIIAQSEEIAKIIHHLITILKSSLADIFNLIESYSKIVLYLEVGSFYKNYNVIFAEISDELYFKQLHHPLLFLYKNDGSVPIDFSCENDKNLVVITGANTGGKTVALKSVGLNLLLTYVGLPIFCRHARCQIFDQIFADIGDKQSLQMSLSTFSSHILNISNIIDVATANSLIIFDELGTGTEAREGASLAIGIIKYLTEIGAKLCLTTHFTEVKNYALNSNKAIIYAVDFDYELFEPRYNLIRDLVGKSDPILIAKRLGFNSKIIALAEVELSKYKSSIDVTIDEINQLKAVNTHQQRELEERSKEIAKRETELNLSSSELKKKLNSKERDILEETYAMLQRAKRLANEKTKIPLSDMQEMINKTESKIEHIKSESEKVSNIAIGDIIFLDRYSKEAKVFGIDNDTIIFDINGIKMKIKKAEVIGNKIEINKKQPDVKITTKDISNNVRHEVVIVGKRVEESLDIIDMFIDKSIGAGYDKIYIIHGRGTGQLRKAVHEYLRTRAGVSTYHLAETADGGNAVTVVQL